MFRKIGRITIGTLATLAESREVLHLVIISRKHFWVTPGNTFLSVIMVSYLIEMMKKNGAASTIRTGDLCLRRAGEL